MTDDVTITFDGVSVSGWQGVRVTRRLEGLPNDADLVLTERYPGELDDLVVRLGAPCVLRIGADVVLTGYIDRYSSGISAGEHQVRVSVRGKCEDLVDCSAMLPGATVNVISALTLAEMLGKPLGITARRLCDEPEDFIPQFNVNLGETPFEVLDRVARYRQLLTYEGTDGALVLDRVGSTRHASGFAQGANVEDAQVELSIADRFSDYFVVWQSVDDLGQVREQTGGANGNQHGHVQDATMPRYRPRVIVSDQIVGGQDIGAARAAWEMNRRNGRSQVARVTADSWRDSAGTLWTPNALAPVDLPACKLGAKVWLIGQVDYLRDASGTHAAVMLMPPEAFQPEPVGLQGSDYQLSQELNGSGGNSQQFGAS